MIHIAFPYNASQYTFICLSSTVKIGLPQSKFSSMEAFTNFKCEQLSTQNSGRGTPSFPWELLQVKITTVYTAKFNLNFIEDFCADSLSLYAIGFQDSMGTSKSLTHTHTHAD